jgi:hypothetical protein
MSATSRYLLDGLAIAVSGEPSPLRERLDTRLGSLPRASGRTPDLTFDVEVTHAPRSTLPRLEGEARPIYESPAGTYLYFSASDELVLDYAGVAVAHARPLTGRTTIRAIARPEAIEVAAHLMFTLPLIEALKRRGRFVVHAAAVASRERCALIAGSTGSGKSTLALVCAYAGMDLLSDDLVFLERRADGLIAHPFPDEIDIGSGTASLLPELARYRGDPSFPLGKRAIPLDQVTTSRTGWSPPPAAILFPVVTRGPVSRLRPMTADDALEALAGNVLATERAASQAHLDALGVLATSCPSYRMEVGRDIDEQPRLVEGAFAT